jgi:hypothetical protein
MLSSFRFRQRSVGQLQSRHNIDSTKLSTRAFPKNETNNKNVADRSIQPNALESISPFLAQSRIVCLNNVQTEARLTMKFFRRQKKSNYKPLVNKTSAQVKVVPPPPNRRPNIEERISMLEMAQLHHLGVYVPENGIRLVLPRDTQPHKNQYSFHDAPRRPKTEIV